MVVISCDALSCYTLPYQLYFLKILPTFTTFVTKSVEIKKIIKDNISGKVYSLIYRSCIYSVAVKHAVQTNVIINIINSQSAFLI